MAILKCKMCGGDIELSADSMDAYVSLFGLNDQNIALIEEELKRVPNEKVRRIATEHIEDIRTSDHRDFRF